MQYPFLCTVCQLCTVGFLVSQLNFRVTYLLDYGLKARISKVRDLMPPAGCDPENEQALPLLLEEPTVFQVVAASTE